MDAEVRLADLVVLGELRVEVAVLPDSVTLTFDGISEDCEFGEGSYVCCERAGGLYVLRVAVGAFSLEEAIDLDHDGCHVESATRDIVVD